MIQNSETIKEHIDKFNYFKKIYAWPKKSYAIKGQKANRKNISILVS